jgi:phosphatidylglycerol:prolipoprotein diacylglycerol transferase
MHPKLFEIGGFTIYTYGVMLALAFFVAIVIAYLKARKVGLQPMIIVDTGIVVLIGAVIGAKLFYVIGHLPEYLADPGRLVDVIRAGGVFQGGLILAVVLSVAYLYWKKQPVWLVADVAAPSIAIGQAIGRIGCFSAGCCYGKEADPTKIPWAVNFPPEAIAPSGVYRHPTQLYEMLLMVVIFVLLMLLWRVRKFDGQVFWAYVILYSIARGGIVEWFRGDHTRLYFGLSGQQIISIFTLIVGVVIYVYLRRRARSTEAG